MSTLQEALLTDLAHSGDFAVSSSGDLQTVSGLANIKQALWHRLVTVPGTLIHQPTYGVGIKLYQNAPTSFTIQQKLASLIVEQFAQDLRVEDVTGVRFVQDDTTPQLFKLIVTVKIVGYSETEMTFTPFGEGT